AVDRRGAGAAVARFHRGGKAVAGGVLIEAVGCAGVIGVARRPLVGALVLVAGAVAGGGLPESTAGRGGALARRVMPRASPRAAIGGPGSDGETKTKGRQEKDIEDPIIHIMVPARGYLSRRRNVNCHNRSVNMSLVPLR